MTINVFIIIIITAQLIQAAPGLEIDIEKEVDYYCSIREEILALTVDTVSMSNAALADGKNILVEGANATSWFCY